MAATKLELHYVESLEEIRESLQNFNAEIGVDRDITRSLVTQTTYWVWDASEKTFGPAKFVGLQSMHVPRYAVARLGHHLGSPFDGHLTRVRIEKILGEVFGSNKQLSARMKNWIARVLPHEPVDRVLAGVDQSKWSFVTLPAKPSQATWSEDEVRRTVADYLSMLQCELAGKPYNKTTHRNGLLKQLPKRNASAVEFKHCNISSALYRMGLPYIDGYKPRGNYQRALKTEIRRQIENDLGLQQALKGDLDEPVDAPPDGSKFNIDLIRVDPPHADKNMSEKGSPRLRKTDWDAASEKSRKLGRQGEQFVIDLERRKLKDAGRSDLAAKIEWVSEEQGDGAGYDVRSFDQNGSDLLIEVKTTLGPKSAPFMITTNELDRANKLGKCYRLYRLFKFTSTPMFYELRAPLKEQLILEPKAYVARVGVRKL